MSPEMRMFSNKKELLGGRSFKIQVSDATYLAPSPPINPIIAPKSWKRLQPLSLQICVTTLDLKRTLAAISKTPRMLPLLNLHALNILELQTTSNKETRATPSRKVTLCSFSMVQDAIKGLLNKIAPPRPLKLLKRTLFHHIFSTRLSPVAT